MSKNLEIKARYQDLERAARAARESGATFTATLLQIDTYFHASHGRLKLRENSVTPDGGATTQSAELIAYRRPDETGTRLSEYHVIPIADPAGCISGLSAVLGVRAVVRKKRDLWHFGRTRIHLDEVADLGRFIELETVLTTQPPEEAQFEHDHLIAVLGIPRTEAIAGSYSEMLIERR